MNYFEDKYNIKNKIIIIMIALSIFFYIALGIIGIYIILSIFILFKKAENVEKRLDELETKSLYYERAYNEMRKQRDAFIKRNCELSLKLKETKDPNTNL